jgi:hypothetical protein
MFMRGMHIIIYVVLAVTTRTAVAHKPKPHMGPHYGPAAKGLQIGIMLPGDKDVFDAKTPIVATVTIQNVSKKPIKIESYIKTDEKQYDWYSFELSWLVPSKDGCGKWASTKSRTIQLDDSRDKSVEITETLAPGATISHDIDVSNWAARSRNGSEPLTPGVYQISIVYDVPQAYSKGVWEGRITSATLPFKITGDVPKGKCENWSDGN